MHITMSSQNIANRKAHKNQRDESASEARIFHSPLTTRSHVSDVAALKFAYASRKD